MFIFFAVLSSAIKEVRNNVNHANAKLTEEKIKDALDTYIVIGNKLHLSEKWRENHKNVEKRNTKRYKRGRNKYVRTLFINYGKLQTNGTFI